MKKSQLVQTLEAEYSFDTPYISNGHVTVAAAISFEDNGSGLSGHVYWGLAVCNPKDQFSHQKGEALAQARLENALHNVDFFDFEKDPSAVVGFIGRAPFALVDSDTNSLLARLDGTTDSLARAQVLLELAREYDSFPMYHYVCEARNRWEAKRWLRAPSTKAQERESNNKPFDIAKLVTATERALGNNPLSTSQDTEAVDHWWARVKAQALINLEEAKEILEAAEKRDLKLLKDGVGDNTYTVMGMVSLAKLRIYDIMRKVCASNLSKLDTDPIGAANSVAHYTSLGIKVTAEPSQKQGCYIIRVTEDSTDIKGKFYPKGKYLKSVENFFEPNL